MAKFKVGEIVYLVSAKNPIFQCYIGRDAEIKNLPVNGPSMSFRGRTVPENHYVIVFQDGSTFAVAEQALKRKEPPSTPEAVSEYNKLINRLTKKEKA